MVLIQHSTQHWLRVRAVRGCVAPQLDASAAAKVFQKQTRNHGVCVFVFVCDFPLFRRSSSLFSFVYFVFFFFLF